MRTYSDTTATAASDTLRTTARGVMVAALSSTALAVLALPSNLSARDGLPRRYTSRLVRRGRVRG